MRVPEKTIELNVCSQLNVRAAGRLLWFGLTQEQEARAGFDACARTGSSMLILQFKASNQIVGGARRFQAPHAQMQTLRNLARADRRIYYVLPTVGTTHDIQTNADLLAQSWLLDVSLLPPTIPAPTTRSGAARRSGVHYVDLIPPSVTIHSEPFAVKVLQASQLDLDFARLDLGESALDTQDGRDFRALRSALRRKAVAAILR
jgi:hypothetical protein